MKSKCARVAVIVPNWLGDAVMSLPLLGFLEASGVAVTIIAPPYTARVYAGMTAVDEWVVISGKGRIGRIRETGQVLRSIRPDAIVILPPSFSSALAARLGGVPVRSGFDTDGRSGLLTVDTPETRSVHLSDSYIALGRLALERMGIAAPRDWIAPRIVVYDEDLAEAVRILRNHGIDDDYVVVVPGAVFGPAKSWPSDRFRQLTAQLAREIPVVITGSAREHALCEEASVGINNAFNTAGETSMGGFLSLLDRASVVVANDSGSPHAAASLGAPVVVLFGSTSPQWTAPLGERVEVIQHVVHCNPCFRRDCPTELECFNGIDPATVVTAVRVRLGSGGAQKGVASERLPG